MVECPHFKAGRCSLVESLAGVPEFRVRRGGCDVCLRETVATREQPGRVVEDWCQLARRENGLPALPRPKEDCPRAPGPGTNLCRRFKEFGFKDTAECGCMELANLMNEWGPDGCRKRVDSDILPRIKKNAKDRGAIYREEIVRPIVMAAIAAAEGKAPTLGQSLAIGIAKIGSALLPESVKNPPRKSQPVSVVIPCHNYGRFLAECIESAIAAVAAEILVVDDSSDDDSAAVAARFPSVGYLKVNHRNVHQTRGAGFAATSQPFVCFLDADDKIAPDYLSKAVALLQDPKNWKVGIVYSDLHQFGNRDHIERFPDRIDPDDLEKSNAIHAGAVVRRRAIQITQPFQLEAPDQSHADWLLWRQLVRDRWEAIKSPAVYHYRIHSDSMMAEMRKQPPVPFNSASTALETITMAILLSNRPWAWQQLAGWLERQTWPHGQIELLIGNTSQNEELGAEIRAWIGRRRDYVDVRHLQFSVAADSRLADAPRVDHPTEVTDAVSRGWSALTRGLARPWTLCLEDDILPPDDAIERMLRAAGPGVDAVCAPYKERHRGGKHWLVFKGPPPGGSLFQDIQVGEEPQGVTQVSGSGFGCLLCRSHILREHPFAPHGASQWYDPSFFAANSVRTVCDWSIVCKHFTGPGEWV